MLQKSHVECQENSFKQIFQNATTFFQIGGEDVNVYGDGTLDGNGQGAVAVDIDILTTDLEECCGILEDLLERIFLPIIL
jgi:hypothetical protein